MTDTPTRLPTHERQLMLAADLQPGDMIPCLGEVTEVEATTEEVRFRLKWAPMDDRTLAGDEELWVDRLVVR